MTKITTDFAGGEATAAVKARITSILQFWRGSTALSGVTNWGQVRTLLNGVSSPTRQILNLENYASFLTDLNFLNDPDQVIPATIFSGSRQGIWLDPSDFASMFQDTAATVPVTAVGQSVALIRDKSGRGNHASQATASKRPVLTRRPKTGLRNQMNGSVSFANNTYWLASPTGNGVTLTRLGTGVEDGLPYVEYSANGTATASGSVVAYASTFGTILGTAGVTTVVSAYGKIVSGTVPAGCGVRVEISEMLGTTFVNSSVGPVFAGTTITRTQISRAITANGDRNRATVGFRVGTGDVIDNVVFRIYAPQHETGSVATAPQFNYSLYDVTEPGVQDCYGLMFDGVDDFLQTGNIAWGTDEVTVTAGLRKLSDAALGAVVELGVGGANGTFSLASATGGLPNYRFLTQGTISSQAVSGTINAPNTAVVSGVGDVSSDSAILRVNASQAAQSAADQGTGNYSTNPLYIGMRAGTSLPFNGILFGLTAVNAVLDATQLGMVELSTNFNTGGF